jgi:hypothetical protein
MFRPSHSITIIVLSSTNREDPVNGRWVNEKGALLERYWQGEKKYCHRKLSHCHFIHHNRHAVLQCSLVTMIRGSESTMHVKKYTHSSLMDFIPCWSKQLSEDSRCDSIWKGEVAFMWFVVKNKLPMLSAYSRPIYANKQGPVFPQRCPSSPFYI